MDGSQRGKPSENQLDDVLHLQIRIFNDASIGKPHQPGGQLLTVRAALNLAQPAGIQSQTQEMQLGFTEHPA